MAKALRSGLCPGTLNSCEASLVLVDEAEDHEEQGGG